MEISSLNTPKNYDCFLEELKKYPQAESRIDQQFRDCLAASRLGCQTPRDVLPFSGKVFEMTQFAYQMKDENKVLYNTWCSLLNQLTQNEGIIVERHALPPTHLRFPLSRTILKGKNITFDKISFLDPNDAETLGKIIKTTLRITEQSCGFSVFSEKSLKMMLTGRDTLCAFAATIEGKVTAVLWGVKLAIKGTSCFSVLFAAREPEYCRQNIYEKMIAAFEPHITNDGHFKCEFLCWKQGTENTINNQALEKFKKEEWVLTRSDSEPYSFESAVHCSIKLDANSTAQPPEEPQVDDALKEYCLEVGDLWTFATEFPILMFKVKLFWATWYNQTFPKLEGYKTSLQPLK